MNDSALKYQFRYSETQLTLTLSGLCPVGSEQNTAVAAIVAELKEHVETLRCSAVVFDFSDLSYSFGDAIGSLWMTCLMNRVPCRIRATGRTKSALVQLMDESLSIPIDDRGPDLRNEPA